MIRALSLAAALALLPVSAAFAQSSDPDAAEAALDAAAEAFESRMDEFAERAEAIGDGETLSEDQKEAAIMALWSEYQPDVAAFTQSVAVAIPDIVADALAEVDVEAVVAEALAEADLAGGMGIAEAVAVGNGMMANGAWASDDPEHQATYGLMADYALGQAMDTVEIEPDSEPSPED
ncbi:hypothetical protein [Brevundimonas poindexterae]|uniref:hypothetical protein n=1 Tax=Brevundimonas poindexterae TaxID=74325 RepID=UPI001CFCB040|nr:hypothetical protein [Brevundimonas poindexterae]